MVKTAWHTTSREWEWLLVDNMLETTGPWPIKECIQRRQVTITAQLACKPIYELCTGAERILGSSRFMRWWDQDVGQEVK